MLRALALVGMCLTLAPAAARAQDGCGLYPPGVVGQSTTFLPGACILWESGMPVLWQGLPEDAVAVMRFVFAGGNDGSVSVVTITELPSGTGRLVTRRLRPGRPLADTPPPRRHGLHRTLSTAELARLGTLAADANVWGFAVGTWDGQAGEGETLISVHCQSLDMERIDAGGYRYSGVSISCVRPRALMPLVDEIVRLGGLRDRGLIR